jgi:hypothetical protein
LSANISGHTNDVIQKYASGLFKGATLEFYGIKTAAIKELIIVELPDVKVTGSSADNIFLLVDDSYLHYEFASEYNKEDIPRYAGYDLRLYERDGRKIQTVIIYTSDVTKADTALSIGSLSYNSDKIMMCEYDGNKIFMELDAKIKAGQELTDVDMLNLIFLPLMKHTIPRKELAVKSIELAQTIPNKTKQDACIAAAYAFARKFLSENEMNSMEEVLKMSDLVVRLVESKATEIAKKLLKRGLSIMDVVEDTDLDEATVMRLQTELNNE